MKSEKTIQLAVNAVILGGDLNSHGDWPMVKREIQKFAKDLNANRIFRLVQNTSKSFRELFDEVYGQALSEVQRDLRGSQLEQAKDKLEEFWNANSGAPTDEVVHVPTAGDLLKSLQALPEACMKMPVVVQTESPVSVLHCVDGTHERLDDRALVDVEWLKGKDVYGDVLAYEYYWDDDSDFEARASKDEWLPVLVITCGEPKRK